MDCHHRVRPKAFQTVFFVCLFLLVFMTQAGGAVSMSERNAVLRSFQNLAIVDGLSAINMWADKALAAQLNTNSADIMGSRATSAPFLAPAVALVAKDKAENAVGAYFNPWINTILLIKIDKKGNKARIVDAGLTVLPEDQPLTGIQPDKAVKILEHRFEQAQTRINEAGKNWASVKSGQTQPDAWKEAKKRLDQEISQARSTLAPDGDPEKARIRDAFEKIMTDIRSSTQTTGLEFVGTEPQEWKNTLLPVHVGELDAYPVVFLASRAYPLSFLWVQIDEAASQPVKQQKIFHVPMAR
jgi:hypothetical protein